MSNLFQSIVASYQLLEQLGFHDPFMRVKMLNRMKSPPSFLEAWIAKYIVDRKSRAIDVTIAALSVLKNSQIPFAQSTYQRHWKVLKNNFFYVDSGWKDSERKFFSFASFVAKELYNYVPYVRLTLFHKGEKVILSQLFDPDEQAFKSTLAGHIAPDIGNEITSQNPSRNRYFGGITWLVGNRYPCSLTFPDGEIGDIGDDSPLLLSFSADKKFVSLKGEVTLKSLDVTQWPVWKPFVALYNDKSVWYTESTKEPPSEKLLPIQTNDVIMFTRTDVENFGGGVIKLHDQVEGNRFRCTIYCETQDEKASFSRVKVLYRDCAWYEVMERFGYKYDKAVSFSNYIATFQADNL